MSKQDIKASELNDGLGLAARKTHIRNRLTRSENAYTLRTRQTTMESKMNKRLFREFMRVRQNMLIPAEEAIQWARSRLHFNRRHGLK